MVVAEVIWVDEEGRQYIQKCDTLNWEKYLKENGWMDFRDRAIDLIQSGICDPFDAEKVVGPINSSPKPPLLLIANFFFPDMLRCSKQQAFREML